MNRELVLQDKVDTFGHPETVETEGVLVTDADGAVLVGVYQGEVCNGNARQCQGTYTDLVVLTPENIRHLYSVLEERGIW